MSVEPSAFLLKEQELMKLNEEINLKTKTLLLRPKPPKPAPVQIITPAITTKHKPKDTAKDQPKNTAIIAQRKSEPESAVSQNSPIPEELRTSPIPVKSTTTRNGQPLDKSVVVPVALERKNLSSEGLIKFLKSKVTILQDEIDVQQKVNLKKTEELQSLGMKSQKLEKHRDDLLCKNNSMQSELKRAEEKIIELELKVKERDNNTVRLGKEGENTRRDLKTLQQNIAALEKRLCHGQNEVEMLKVNLASAYDREREARDERRAEKDATDRHIKQLRRQRINLITAYKQQLLLLDNLKRQNLCLEEAKMLEFSEKEFTKILNWEK